MAKICKMVVQGGFHVGEHPFQGCTVIVSVNGKCVLVMVLLYVSFLLSIARLPLIKPLRLPLFWH